MKRRFTVHVFILFLCVCMAISACSGASPQPQEYTSSSGAYVSVTSDPDITSDTTDAVSA